MEKELSSSRQAAPSLQDCLLTGVKCWSEATIRFGMLWELVRQQRLHLYMPESIGWEPSIMETCILCDACATGG
eukprot:2807815-Amphidinium_carterae.1